jgi:hypothetical protein
MSMLRCVIVGFHSVVEEDYSLLGYDAMFAGSLLPTFHSSLLLPSSG